MMLLVNHLFINLIVFSFLYMPSCGLSILKETGLQLQISITNPTFISNSLYDIKHEKYSLCTQLKIN